MMWDFVLWVLGALFGGLVVQLRWPIKVSMYHADGHVLFIKVQSGLRNDIKEMPPELIAEIAEGR